jgi:hypothetical protein
LLVPVLPHGWIVADTRQIDLPLPHPRSDLTDSTRVWVRPSGPDPLEGAWLVVSTWNDDDDADGPDQAHSRSPITESRVEGTVLRHGESPTGSWYGWRIPYKPPFDLGLGLAGLVAGRGAGAAELRRVARWAAAAPDPRAEPPTGVLGKQWRPLAHGSGSIWALCLGYSVDLPAVVTELEGPGQSHIDIRQVRADPARLLITRAGISDVGGTMIRGHRGSAGPGLVRMDGDYGRVELRTWSEAGVDITVAARNVSPRVLDRMITRLRIGTYADLGL